MQIRIELDEKENAYVKKRAKELGMTKKEYLRNVALDGAVYMLDLQNAQPFLEKAGKLIEEMREYSQQLRQHGYDDKADEVISAAASLKADIRKVVFASRKTEKGQ